MVNLTGTKRGKVLIIGFDKVINEMNFWKCHCQKCQNIFSKSEAYWISEWILKQKSMQKSGKKEAWFDSVTRKMQPTYKIEKHIPQKKETLENNTINRLKK